jgi:hypothetical protein
MERKRWQDLTPQQRAGTIVMSVVQLALLAAAQIDISRRPEEQIRGTKQMWRLISFINYFGPIAYFLFGRIPEEQAVEPEPNT